MVCVHERVTVAVGGYAHEGFGLGCGHQPGIENRVQAVLNARIWCIGVAAVKLYRGLRRFKVNERSRHRYTAHPS